MQESDAHRFERKTLGHPPNLSQRCYSIDVTLVKSGLTNVLNFIIKCY